MRDEVRSEASGAGPFVHPALFYRSMREYMEGTVPFVLEGLYSGEPVAVAVPGARLELLRAQLGARADQVQWHDMQRAGRNPGRIIPGVLRAFADEHPDRRVRIIGEPVWPGRTATEYPACAQHEALINLAFADRPMTILCPYDAARLDATALADAHATHPVTVGGGRLSRSAAYAPDRVVAAYNTLPPPPPDTVPDPFDAEHLADARHLATERARRLGLSGERLGDFSLAAGELITNSVVHAGGSGSVGVWTEDGHVVCEVADAGRLDDPLAGRRPAVRGMPHGRGLLMVHHLADLVRTRTGADGTRVRFYLRLPSPA
ncbi:anti-sigma factor RsbA family regulatory protein [Streptomyces sp. NPDC088354]|uniref:anti-sigma factor RsbA family regulatory protein n=1 Tax=Streptomyces sp. NPDC088354 TaxID=3365856 RepID=UPI00382EC4CC